MTSNNSITSFDPGIFADGKVTLHKTTVVYCGQTCVEWSPATGPHGSSLSSNFWRLHEELTDELEGHCEGHERVISREQGYLKHLNTGQWSGATTLEFSKGVYDHRFTWTKWVLTRCVVCSPSSLIGFDLDGNECHALFSRRW